MSEINQIPNDIRRRLEKMSVQELKAMHAKTLELLEKWQVKPAPPTLSLDKTKDNLNTFKPKDFFDHQKENEKPTFDIEDLEDNLEMHEMREIEMYDVTEQKKVIVTACKDFDNDDDYEYTYLVLPGGGVTSLDMLNDRKFLVPNESELQKVNEEIDALSKSIAKFVEDEHGVDTPFTEYKYGEFYFGNKEDGKAEFKITEGKDGYFEIHIENEDFEDGFEKFPAFHKDELELEPAPEREQIEETHELNIEFR